MKKENGTRNCVVFPKYLFSFISISVSTCSSRINNPLFKAKKNFFKNYFFLFGGYPMEQTEPKYEQFRKLKYAQETSFVVYTSFPIFNV